MGVIFKLEGHHGTTEALGCEAKQAGASRPARGGQARDSVRTHGQSGSRAAVVRRGQNGLSDCGGLQVHPQTVRNWRKHFVEESFPAVLQERPRPGAQPKLSEKAEATLVAWACSDPPQGREHWTMQLLADKLVELGVVDSLSDETVRRALKKTRSSRGRRNTGASRK